MNVKDQDDYVFLKDTEFEMGWAYYMGTARAVRRGRKHSKTGGFKMTLYQSGDSFPRKTKSKKAVVETKPASKSSSDEDFDYGQTDSDDGLGDLDLGFDDEEEDYLW